MFNLLFCLNMIILNVLLHESVAEKLYQFVVDIPLDFVWHFTELYTAK